MEDFRKKYSLKEEQVDKYEELKCKILLINRIESFFIKKNLEKFLNKDFEIVKNIRVSIIRILEELNSINDAEEKIFKINLFLDFIEYNFEKLDIEYINGLIIGFVKKINKNKISEEKLKKINLTYNGHLSVISTQKIFK